MQGSGYKNRSTLSFSEPTSPYDDEKFTPELTDPNVMTESNQSQASTSTNRKAYKAARQQLLEDIVPAEDSEAKTSKFLLVIFIFSSPYSLPVPMLLLLLLSLLLLHML